MVLNIFSCAHLPSMYFLVTYIFAFVIPSPFLSITMWFLHRHSFLTHHEFSKIALLCRWWRRSPLLKRLVSVVAEAGLGVLYLIFFTGRGKLKYSWFWDLHPQSQGRSQGISGMPSGTDCRKTIIQTCWAYSCYRWEITVFYALLRSQPDSLSWLNQNEKDKTYCFLSLAFCFPSIIVAQLLSFIKKMNHFIKNVEIARDGGMCL